MRSSCLSRCVLLLLSITTILSACGGGVQLVQAQQPITAECWEPGPGQPLNCDLFAGSFLQLAPQTHFILAGPHTWNSLNVNFPLTEPRITLVISNIEVQQLGIDNADLASVELRNVRVQIGITSAQVPIQTLNITSDCRIVMNQAWTIIPAVSFLMRASALVSTVDGTAFSVSPSADNVTIAFTGGASISLTRTVDVIGNMHALVIAPRRAAIALRSLVIADTTVTINCGQQAPSCTALYIAGSPIVVDAVPLIVWEQLTISGQNTFNATSSGAVPATGLAILASAPSVTVAQVRVGVSTGSGAAVGLSLSATAGNFFFVTGANVLVVSSGSTATGVHVGQLTKGAALDIVESVVRAVGSASAAAGGNSLGIAFDASLSSAGYAFRVMHTSFDVTAAGAGAGRAFFLKPPATVNSGFLMFGNLAIAAAGGFVSANFSAVAAGTGSHVYIRCSTLNGAALSSALVPSAPPTYSTFLPCGAAGCSHAVDCNQTTTGFVVLGAADRCMCTCNAEYASRTWLPIANQCSGYLAITTASTTTTTSTTTTITTTATATATATATTPNATVDPALLVNDKLPWAAVLGLSIMGLAVGLLTLIALVCCLCFCCCAAPADDEDEIKSDIDEKEAQEDEEAEEVEEESNAGGRRFYQKSSGRGGGGDGGSHIVVPPSSNSKKKKPTRPPPPPPDEIMALRKEKYLLMQDRRLMEAHMDEILRLEAEGERDRAKALRSELADLDASYRNRRASISKSQEQHRGRNRSRRDDGNSNSKNKNNAEEEESEDEPDIALTPETEEELEAYGAEEEDVGYYSAARQRELLDDPIFRERVALLTLGHMEKENQKQQKQQHIDNMEHRLENVEEEVGALNEKMREISPQSHAQSPESVGAHYNSVGGTPNQRGMLIYRGDGVPLPAGVTAVRVPEQKQRQQQRRAPATTGTSRSANSATNNEMMREPFSESPIDEFNGHNPGRPRLSRTSPFRFSVTPDSPNNNNSSTNNGGHQRDSVGMIAVAGGGPAARSGAGGGLRVIALRGNQSSSEEDEDEVYANPVNNSARPRVVDQYGPPRRNTPLYNPIANRLPRQQRQQASALPVAPPQQQRYQYQQQQQQQQQQQPDEEQGAEEQEALHAEEEERQPRYRAAREAAALPVFVANEPLVGMSAQQPPMPPMEPPRRGSPLRATAHRFMEKEKHMLSPQFQQYHSPQQHVGTPQPTTMAANNARYWRPQLGL